MFTSLKNQIPSIPWNVEVGPEPARLRLYAGTFGKATGPVHTQSPMLIFSVWIRKVRAHVTVRRTGATFVVMCDKILLAALSGLRGCAATSFFHESVHCRY